MTLRAQRRLDEGVSCNVETGRALVTAGLHEATVSAEGDLDFRGTLGVSKQAPVGFRDIRQRFDLVTDAGEEQRATLVRLTERYCVVYQTVRRPVDIEISHGSIGR